MSDEELESAIEQAIARMETAWKENRKDDAKHWWAVSVDLINQRSKDRVELMEALL